MDYNDGTWWGWSGGECPVHPETLVEVMLADGDKMSKEAAAGWTWDDCGLRSIVAFRVVEPHREPRMMTMRALI